MPENLKSNSYFIFPEVVDWQAPQLVLRKMEKYNKILEKVISTGFPELSKCNIQLNNLDLNKEGFKKNSFSIKLMNVQKRTLSLFFRNRKPTEYFINYDKTALEDFEGLSETALEGAFAHECAHLVLDVNETPLESLLTNYLYAYNKKYRILVERNADMEVIIRGYGKQLLELKEYFKKYQLISPDPIDIYGITRAELKKIV